MYHLIGIVLASLGLAAALYRVRRPSAAYAADVYHMTGRSHRTFALVSAGALAGFGASFAFDVVTVPLLALYALAFILYASSFARGFSGEDE